MAWNIGGKVLDIYDDPDFAALAASPYFEKVASLPMGNPDLLGGLEDRQFGVVFLTKKGEAIRKYPLNDVTNAVLSNVYFEMTHDRLPPEAKVAAATQIRDASVVFGFRPMDAVLKYAADESLEGRNYVRMDKIAGSVAQSIDFLGQLKDSYVENRDRYSREDRRELASAVFGMGEKLAADLNHPDLDAFKPLTTPEIDKEALFSQCAQRKQLLQDRPEATHLMDEFLAKHASFDPRETVKLLETFDTQFGVDKYWTRGLEPNLILREKVAYHDMPVAMSGSAFSNDEVQAWMSSNGDLMKKMFGKELSEKLSKAGDLYCLPTASRNFLYARMEHDRDNSPSQAS